ncbi:MAG: hypothetical protein H7Y89_02285 [Steroidobacteraceae bacterium]|nr:hypothetical protein [Steroidobacteraceae bacterium]
MKAGPPDLADALLALGRAHLATGRVKEARAPLAEADAFWRAYDAQSRWAERVTAANAPASGA